MSNQRAGEDSGIDYANLVEDTVKHCRLGWDEHRQTPQIK